MSVSFNGGNSYHKDLRLKPHDSIKNAENDPTTPSRAQSRTTVSDFKYSENSSNKYDPNMQPQNNEYKQGS